MNSGNKSIKYAPTRQENPRTAKRTPVRRKTILMCVVKTSQVSVVKAVLSALGAKVSEVKE